jgi:hypothetical protein
VSLTEIERLLSAAQKPLPLTRGSVQPIKGVCDIALPDRLFPKAAHPREALAGLVLRLGCWEQSHSIAQEIATREASYWHGIIHRMEPDSANARYWFRQTGAHPVFAQLRSIALQILAQGEPKDWRLGPSWDPFAFIDWCEQAREERGAAEMAATRIHNIECELLFDYCRKENPPAQENDAGGL